MHLEPNESWARIGAIPIDAISTILWQHFDSRKKSLFLEGYGKSKKIVTSTQWIS